MPLTSTLDADGQRVLDLLVARLPMVKPNDPRTFVGYKDAHDQLRLPQVRDTFGESLKVQGLEALAEWTLKTGKPAITGLVIDRTTMMPGKGYFSLFSKSEDDFIWWAGEVERSMKFDWNPYVSAMQPPPSPVAVDIGVPPDRKEVVTYRVIRDTPLARRVKQLYNYECQLCRHTILLTDGTRYAEAHHVRPLGQPHNGPDSIDNIVCVCPNHHAELDYGARSLAIVDLHLVAGHSVSELHIEYHNKHVRREH